MMWILITVSVFFIVSVYININLLIKTERLDSELTDVSLTLADVLTTIEQVYQDMQEIDSKGSFKSDDEVGHIFTSLKQEIDMLREKYIGDTDGAK